MPATAKETPVLTDIELAPLVPVDSERNLRMLVLRLLAAFLAVSLFALVFLFFPWWTGFPMVTMACIVSAALILAAATSPVVQIGKEYKIPVAVTIALLVLATLTLIGLVT